jgi:hypothetical protein
MHRIVPKMLINWVAGRVLTLESVPSCWLVTHAAPSHMLRAF